jgi:aminoglycoside phosphotransferase (APT) family kinase protein
MPFGLIDFDSAHPGKREDDVGYAAWMWLYIGNDKLAPEDQGSKLVDFVAAYDAGATWNPLELVLHAQHELVARLPKGVNKWAAVRKWALACIDWTERNRDGIGAGIAMRSDNSPGQR